MWGFNPSTCLCNCFHFFDKFSSYFSGCDILNQVFTPIFRRSFSTWSYYRVFSLLHNLLPVGTDSVMTEFYCLDIFIFHHHLSDMKKPNSMNVIGSYIPNLIRLFYLSISLTGSCLTCPFLVYITSLGLILILSLFRNTHSNNPVP